MSVLLVWGSRPKLAALSPRRASVRASYDFLRDTPNPFVSAMAPLDIVIPQESTAMSPLDHLLERVEPAHPGHLVMLLTGPARASAHHDSLVSDSFPPWLRDPAQAVANWMLQPIVLTLVVSTSVLLLVLSLVGLPLVLTRMPSDFFSRPERSRVRLADRERPFWFVVVRSLKNALGGVLLLLGLLMLVMPGQGLVTIFVALFLLDFPGKRRLQRWVISRPVVNRPVNALRRRAGRPPLDLPARR